MNTLLRQQRLSRELTVHDVAHHLSVHPASVLRWERRERLPGPVHLVALAATLSLETATVAEFFDEVRPASAGPPVGVRATGLRDVRRTAGVPVRQIAAAVGVLTATVYNWEAGRVRIPVEHLPVLARLFSTDAASLRSRLESAPAAAGAAQVSALRRFRRRTGLSQQQVAERIGTTRRRLGAWERGTRPPVWAVRRLAPVYGVSVSRLARAAGVSAPPLLDVARWRAGDLPEVLTALRTWSGLTQRELAERGGWHPTTVRSWESGRSRPTPGSRARVEFLYGLPEGALVAAYPPVTAAADRSSHAPAGSAR